MAFRIPTKGGLAAVAIVLAAGCGVQQTDMLIRVLDARTQAPVVGATVTANDRDQATNMAGVTHFLVRPNSYDVTVAHQNYLPLTKMVSIYPGPAAAFTIYLYPRPDGPVPPSPGPGVSPAPGASVPPGPKPTNDPGVAVFGRVVDDKGTRIPGAMVMFQTGWIVVGSASTNAQGEYRVEHLPRGQQLNVTAAADGYDAMNRSCNANADWRLDFASAFALKHHVEPAPAPDRPANIAISGKIEDTMGRPLDGVVVRVESSNVRFPFNQTAIGRNGRYRMVVPTDLPLRFTASKANFHTMSFTDTVPAASFGGGAQEDFAGPRALDAAPILEGG
ncbi:MAG: hypothetical protein JWM80_5492 [Cyanobacteria bacterium RYN_339]|nr:hypothetical protein [Cyanobacteria bacterium RYN_339]